MAKYCHIVNHQVTYQFCMDCDDKICEQKKFETKKVESQQEEICICDTCNHKCAEEEMTLFGNTARICRCDIFKNTMFNALKIHTECEYHNVDVSEMKICLNCEHFLGGGDWGLACNKHYHRLPGPVDKACEDFGWKTK